MSRTTRRSHFKETACSNIESYIRQHHGYYWYVPARPTLYGPVNASAYLEYGRDGREKQGRDRSRRYRKGTNQIIRESNRIKLKKLIDNLDEFDNMTFDDKHSGKRLKWMIWW
jgi:hypothetical protein